MKLFFGAHHDGLPVQIEHVRAEILPSLPLNTTQEWSHRIKGAVVPKFSKNALVQVGANIEYSHLTVVEDDGEGIVNVRLH